LGEKFEFEFKYDVSRATSGTAQRDLLFWVSLLERIFIFTIGLLSQYHLYLLLLVRLGGYIANLYAFYSYRLIGN
jgi:hypothetical protein